jgi:hypothetical protein
MRKLSFLEDSVAKAVISEPSNFPGKKAMPKVDNGECFLGEKNGSLLSGSLNGR